MTTISARTRRILATAIAVAAITVATGPVSNAGSSTITCTGGSQVISNWSGGASSEAITNSNGTCGNVGHSGKLYIGGGAYSWSSVSWYGSIGGCWVKSYSYAMQQSRHYWSYNGNATSKYLSV